MHYKMKILEKSIYLRIYLCNWSKHNTLPEFLHRFVFGENVVKLTIERESTLLFKCECLHITKSEVLWIQRD